MTAISDRFIQGISTSLKSIPISTIVGASFGFVYAKLSNIPAGQTAKVYAIWHLAHAALTGFAQGFFHDNLKAKPLSTTAISIISVAVAIPELLKRGLMGQKLKILIIAGQAINIACTIITCCLKND